MKKNFIIYTSIIFILTSLSIFAQRVVEPDKLEYNQKTQLYHYGNEKEPFTGIEKAYYEDKSLKYELPSNFPSIKFFSVSNFPLS